MKIIKANLIITTFVEERNQIFEMMKRHIDFWIVKKHIWEKSI